ncbi:hypothetical protein SAMN05216266_105235 [Amycolatopsis marina]|uniref:TipAS antibiotic-recognition domain-containing protein n=1 Tax=Amycolatopsis marina TaxID=490629 RepID=A0A1I0YQL9_9PSEU|nr:hypothetical protein [Amycolatopsis marina]SFB15086.1 hypothetical protein SAMN05216266_105235 [Amycolatopsis marina]
MTEAWERARRRRQLTHAVLDGLVDQRNPVLTHAQCASIEAEFGDLDSFLGEVQAYWYRAFDARLDQLLAEDDPELGARVDALWQALSREQPAARRLLDAYADRPTLRAGQEHHRQRLLTATGADQEFFRKQRAMT